MLLHNLAPQGVLGGDQLARGVDAHERQVVARLDALHGQPLGHGQLHQVGDVVFPGLVLVGEAGQERPDGLDLEQVDARVHLAGDRAVQVQVVVLGLHDGRDAPLGVAHHPAEGTGVARGDGHEGQVAAALRGHQPVQRLHRDQRGIAVDDQAMGGPGPGQGVPGHLQGVARAELVLLHDEPVGHVREGGPHVVGVVADHGQDVLPHDGPERLVDVKKHGFAKQGLQHLGPGGMHPGAFPGRQDEGGNLRVGHMVSVCRVGFEYPAQITRSGRKGQ